MSIWEYIQIYGARLASGTAITCAQFLLAAVIAVVVALLAGLGKLSHNKLIRGISVVYIEIFRGTSLLVQLYWIYYVLPLFGVPLDNFTAGILGVGMNLGAYGAELVRGGIQSVPRGQYEAAIALNMSPIGRMRRVIMPQAILNMLPPWGTLLIELLKGTALVSLI